MRRKSMQTLKNYVKHDVENNKKLICSLAVDNEAIVLSVVILQRNPLVIAKVRGTSTCLGFVLRL